MKQHEDSTEHVAAQLDAELRESGVLAAGFRWKRLDGGRTNRVWLLENGDRRASLVCRLFLNDRGTPLFPNLPHAEVTAFGALAGTGLAPELYWHGETGKGRCLIYRACLGQTWQSGVRGVAHCLARLHRQRMPRGLRRIGTSPADLIAEGMRMLNGLTIPERETLLACQPRPSPVSPGPDAFLHGDPVPGNIVMTAGGAVLIDWQCPGIGDPVHDLAIFLSPAMQTLGRGAALTMAERSDCLQSYGDPAVAARYEISEAAFTWHMACYCTWRMAHGHADYAPALAAELHRLNQLR
ncbi:aminoglycoside phosphotransferase family protein [Oceaniglobus trochenteri]|uniref:aminoglycoside phosphotransferase family protein n=1 Tax=Oceaniglobus trochenteri TaxID=2763260 RepID=UPI001CFF5F4F|nr:aminoglycoside phosphotransferase family protein [Oceaniglobus trochenteri]